MADHTKPEQAAPDRADMVPAQGEAASAPPPRQLPPAALRALSEAEARRKAAGMQQNDRPPELNGPRGPEPTRYGDWERKGVASDF